MNIVSAIFFMFFSISLSCLVSTASWANEATSAAQPFVEKAKLLHLAQSPEWLRLMHYRKKWLRGLRSEVDGANFFVAPNGKTNPDAELVFTIEGFFSSKKRALEDPHTAAQTVRCQFPARYEWLNRELQLDSSVPRQDCKEFNEFRDLAGAKSVILVFSSFDVQTPSTAFGHSLLRLSKTISNVNDSEHHQLLDRGINYAANPSVTNPILYSVAGLIGLFRGTFSNVPFYYKVREYSDFESRDLWEYDLKLSQEEVDRVVDHIWELGSTYFNYYFLTDNCSYHMLTLLEVASPRLHLLDEIPFWVIPTDTIKALYAQPNFVKEAHFRPSINSQFMARVNKLSRDEKKDLSRIVEKKETKSALADPVSQAKVLDAYMDYVDSRNAIELQDKKPDVMALKQSLLLARSRLPITDALVIPTPLDLAPHLSHGSERIMLRQAFSQNLGPGTGLDLRFALHDLLDSQMGLPKSAEIEFATLNVRWYERDNILRLEDLGLIGVGAYQPLTRYQKTPTIRIRVGADRVYDPRCDNCTAGFARAGMGGTLQLLDTPNVLTYALAEGSVETSPSFVENKLTTLVGPTLGLRIGFFPNAWFLTEARYRTNLNTPVFEETRIDTSLRVTPIKEWALDAKAEYGKFDRIVSFALAHYF